MEEMDHGETVRTELTAHIDGQRLDDVVKAIREFERTATKVAFEAGFRAGWEQATKAVQDAFSRSGRGMKIPVGNMNVQVETHTVEKLEPQPSLLHGSSTSEKIYSQIELRPGLRGVELVSALKENGLTLLERTVRTVLWRLKNAGRIKAVDGRWYTPESAPPEPPFQQEEATMPPPAR